MAKKVRGEGQDHSLKMGGGERSQGEKEMKGGNDKKRKAGREWECRKRRME